MHLICRTHSYAAASLSHRFGKTPSPARSPIDAPIDLVVGGRLRCQIPIGLNVHPVIGLRIAFIPQRREDFVDSGDQHRPQVVRRCALGRRRLGRKWDCLAQRHHPRCALARGGWIGLNDNLLGRLCRCRRCCCRWVYFRTGGTSVQLPCATSAAMPMLSPKVGCG